MQWWCVAVMVVAVVVVVVADTHMEEALRGTKERERRKELKEIEREKKKEEEEEEEEEEEKGLPSLLLRPEEVSLVEGDNSKLELFLNKVPQGCVNVSLILEDPLGTVTPSFVILCDLTPANVTLEVTSRGTTTITASASPPQWVSQTSPFCVVSVMGSQALTTAADVMGWLYTIAWDVSFLPQIIHNWRRKSVVGLSFDFLTFNWIGFFSYFIFNMGLYWIYDIQIQYSIRYPGSILHVRLNDVIFPLYAVVCVTLQIGQCLLYERAEGQRVSVMCRVLSGILVASAAVGCLLVPLVKSWWWLDVLYLLSYVKLTITCIKYVPQLWVNYKGRSTAGWSIYQVILDFTGGMLSLVQMFMLSGNYGDWLSLLTDPAKLGLGLLSIMFNILFFIQHYCLYRTPPSSAVRELKGKDGPLQGSEWD
ncbi:hypothetical protein O3P69_020326 [Scylla paramamosain]|uniref:Cystinosin n=1 Tax=Scylla paramamosain TaxID=85552 RepID=A0AAW0SIN5_SCYPA